MSFFTQCRGPSPSQRLINKPLLTRTWLKRRYRAAPRKLNEAVEQRRIEKIRRARPTKFNTARRKRERLFSHARVNKWKMRNGKWTMENSR